MKLTRRTFPQNGRRDRRGTLPLQIKQWHLLVVEARCGSRKLVDVYPDRCMGKWCIAINIGMIVHLPLLVRRMTPMPVG